MANEKKISLSTEVQELSDKILKELNCDKETGIAAPVNTFEKFMPEDLSMDIFKRANNYTRDHTAAAIHAAGIHNIGVMSENKKLDQTTYTFPMEGRDKVEVVFKRSEPFSNQLTKDTGTYYGNPHPKVSMRAGDKGVQLKNAIALVREAAAAKLS